MSSPSADDNRPSDSSRAHLVRVVTAARADDFRAGGDRHVREDFRNRIGHREDDRILRHRLDHVARRVAEAAIKSGVAQLEIKDFDAYEASVAARIKAANA